jgi:hypothetical protein
MPVKAASIGQANERVEPVGSMRPAGVELALSVRSVKGEGLE